MAINSDAAMAVAFFLSSAAVVWAAVFAWTRWLVRPTQDSLLASQDYEYRLEQRLDSIDRAVQEIGMEL